MIFGYASEEEHEYMMKLWREALDAEEAQAEELVDRRQEDDNAE